MTTCICLVHLWRAWSPVCPRIKIKRSQHSTWRAIELLPVEKDAINGPAMIKYFAIIAAWVGEKDLACEQLAIAIDNPGALSYGQLKLLPFWDPLRGDPRLEKIVASVAPKEN
jgi:hypothetical protein